MKTPSRNALKATLVGLAIMAGRGAPAAAQSVATTTHPPYTPADAQFMTGMIGHHAQAVLIANWAPTHGASPAILRLSERIVAGQGDEIDLMKRWLSDYGEPVPEGTAHYMAGMDHDMPGMDHGNSMPGMLTQEQLAQLDAARGPEFDRLFLTFMIQHHQGAVGMVHKLFNTPGSAQNEQVFKFASDVQVDQSTEIARMEKMLFMLKVTGPQP